MQNKKQAVVRVRHRAWESVNNININDIYPDKKMQMASITFMHKSANNSCNSNLLARVAVDKDNNYVTEQYILF